jgi:hypothetical protein
VVNAKHLNPLSELPGNMLIEQQLEQCICSDTVYQVLYFDINNLRHMMTSTVLKTATGC